jgi:hypothetical protein
MSLPEENVSPTIEVSIPQPPPAPRQIADKFIWNLMLTNGWVIAGGVFAFIGGIFSVVGLSLTVAIFTAFVGIPFLLMGIVFFGGGLAVILWRYQETQKTIDVLRNGQPANGQIADMQENLNVRVNHRHPWMITYTFQTNGQTYQGNVSTLRRPDFRTGQQVCVLYLPQNPDYNALYPHP